jgi:hypothetical protein
MPITPTGVEVSALIPNLKGAQLALDNGVRRLAFVMSVSESHNINNVRRSTAESIDELKRILALKEKHPDMIVDVGMATVFGCPFEGKISPRVVLQFVRRFYELGIRGMTVADTVGFGNPKEIMMARPSMIINDHGRLGPPRDPRDRARRSGSNTGPGIRHRARLDREPQEIHRGPGVARRLRQQAHSHRAGER